MQHEALRRERKGQEGWTPGGQSGEHTLPGGLCLQHIWAGIDGVPSLGSPGSTQRLMTHQALLTLPPGPLRPLRGTQRDQLASHPLVWPQPPFHTTTNATDHQGRNRREPDPRDGRADRQLPSSQRPQWPW